MHRATSRIIGLVGVFGLMLPLSAAAGQLARVIRVGQVGSGYGKPTAMGPGAVLAAKGWAQQEFARDGIQIKDSYFIGTGPAINEALANGSLDIASYGDLPAIIGRAAGLKTVVLAGSRGSLIYVIVPARSSIHSLHDLIGKRIGVQRGTYLHLSFDRKLASLGLSENEFRMVNISNADGEAAIASGGLDAFVDTVGALRLQSTGMARVIYTNKYDPDDWKGQSVLVVQQDFLNRYPDLTKRYLKVWLRAMRWESDEKNRQEALKIDASSGRPESVLAQDRSGIPLTKLYNPLLDASFTSHYKYAVQFAKEHGYISRPFDVDSWLDRSLLSQALKEIGWSPR